MADDLFSNVALRDDIKSGDLRQDQFAANLQEVIEGKGPDTYRDANRFFETSHPSDGLRNLLNEALGRITGTKSNAPSIIRLETGLGGGKTHSLIGLYHGARREVPESRLSEFMDPKYLPSAIVQKIAIFVGDEAGATSGFASRDGIKPQTLWGHIALQLGGAVAYEHVKVDDQRMTAPGAEAMESIIGDDMAIVMIDEIARYLTVAAGVKTGDNTLADQTVAFMMSLIRAIEAKPHAVLVVTTTEATDVFGEETDRFLRGISSILARKEHIIRPTGESDLAAILARRLFSNVSAQAPNATASLYADAIAAATAAGASVAEHMRQATWIQAIERSYPFHPSLISVLDKRISTMPNFQHTRGALRILALAARRLWEAQPAKTLLIHTHHLDLKVPEIAEEVTGHIARTAFKTVIEKDIASAHGGELAQAELIDAQRGGHYAQNLATTIYYWSLTRDIPGVPESELLGSVLAPGDDVNQYLRGLELLTNDLELGAWYIAVEPRGGLRFGTEAAPGKVLAEIRETIKPTDVSRKCIDILEDLFKDGTFKVKRMWQGANVPDNSKDAYLAIFNWDEFVGDKGVDTTGKIPDKINDLWANGPAGGPRLYRNRLVILAPDASQHPAMLKSVREHIALRTLVDSNENMARFTLDQQNKIRKDEQTSELEVKVAVASHMSLLFVPQKDGLQMITMPVPNQADIRKNQTDTVLKQLEQLGKVLIAGSNALAPFFLKTKLGIFFDTAQTTASLEERFASNADFKILLDVDSLRATIQNGISNGDWEYYNPALNERGWATKTRPGAVVEISSQTFIYPPKSAPPEQAALCPMCGRPHNPGPCPPTSTADGGFATPDPSVSASQVKSVFTKSGAAGAATTSAVADSRDADRQISAIEVAVHEIDKSLVWRQFAALSSLIQAGTKGISVRYNIEANVELREPGDAVKVTFDGSSDDMQNIKESLRSLFMKNDNRSAILNAKIKAVFANPQDPNSNAVAAVVQAATDRGPSNCTVAVTTEERGAA